MVYEMNIAILSVQVPSTFIHGTVGDTHVTILKYFSLPCSPGLS
jgi:hypothetical protein